MVAGFCPCPGPCFQKIVPNEFLETAELFGQPFMSAVPCRQGLLGIVRGELPALNYLYLPHFLSRTGVHFGGKCFSDEKGTSIAYMVEQNSAGDIGVSLSVAQYIVRGENS